MPRTQRCVLVPRWQTVRSCCFIPCARRTGDLTSNTVLQGLPNRKDATDVAALKQRWHAFSLRLSGLTPSAVPRHSPIGFLCRDLTNESEVAWQLEINYPASKSPSPPYFLTVLVKAAAWVAVTKQGSRAGGDFHDVAEFAAEAVRRQPSPKEQYSDSDDDDDDRFTTESDDVGRWLAYMSARGPAPRFPSERDDIDDARLQHVYGVK